MADAPGRPLSARGLLALALAQLGFRVFPLKPGSKRPAVTNWPAGATTDAKVIESWWSTGYDFNIGIATGRATDDRGGKWLVVIDYDMKPGQSGARALWWHTFEGWDETYTVKTPNGVHRYYWCNREIANSVGKVAEHVDVRGRRGYVVAPGSVVEGREYVVERNGAVADLPVDLEALAASATTAAKTNVASIPVDRIDSAWAVAWVKEYLINEAPFAVSGSGGNRTTYDVACKCMDYVSRDVCLELMLGFWNDEKADSPEGPWPEKKLEEIVDHAREYKQTPIGSRNVMLEFEEEIKAEGERERSPFPWIDIRPWDGQQPPERQWAVQDRVPIPQVGLFSGAGGGGKSIIELTRNVAHCVGGEWMGGGVKQGGAFYIGMEDDQNEVWRRLAVIAAHYGTNFVELDRLGLKIFALPGAPAVLVDWDAQTRRAVETKFYKMLLAEAERLKPVNISIDTLAKVFAGNEIERVQVYGFAGLMQRLAMASGGAVTVLAHPSLTGLKGSGISGSTAWHDAFRFRMYLKSLKAQDEDTEAPDDGLRELEFRKNQYGPLSKAVVLRWSAGMFLPVETTEADRLVKEEIADKVFLAVLARFNELERNVSDNAASPKNYAPKVIAEEASARNEKLSVQDLTGAMRRLFDAGKIHNQSYKLSGHMRQRLVVRSTLKSV